MFQKTLTKALFLSLKAPKLVLLAYSFLLLCCFYILALGLTIKSSNLDLLPTNAPAVKKFEDLAKQYGTPNSIVVIVESKSEKLRVNISVQVEQALLKLKSIGAVVYKSPLSEEMLLENDMKRYFAAENYQILLVQPNDTRSNVDQLIPLIYKIQKVVDHFKTKEISIHLAGLPILAKDDQETVLTELPLLGLFSLILIALFMFSVLKNYRFVAYGFIALIVSCTLSLSFTYFIPGHLNLLSSTFLAISFGLNVDYLIHFIYSFEEGIEWIDEKSLKESLLKVLPSMSSSCLSTAGVFFTIAFTEFKGFAELGLTAGCALIVGLFVFYSFFPALLMFSKAKIKTSQAKNLHLDVFGSKKYALFTLLLSLGLCFVAKFQFEGNYLNLQPIQSEAVAWEKKLNADGLYSSNTYLMEIQGAEQAYELSEKLRSLPEVERVQSIVELESYLESEDRLDLLDSQLKKKFKSGDDHYLLYILSSLDLWDDKTAQKLNIKLQKLHDSVTGLPILAELVTELSVKSLRESFYASLVLLFFLLLMRFKNIRLSLIALSPSILTSFGLLGVLSLCSYSLNSISMIALPLILGLALDDGIYLCHAMTQSKQEQVRTRSAVIFTSITTILSFSCLIFTDHRGIASFGLNISIGVFLAMVYSLMIIPLLYQLCVKQSKS